MKIERTQRSAMEGLQAQSPDEVLPSSYPKVVDNELVFDFPEGIPAFEDYHKYCLKTNEEIKPFVYLNSIELDNLGFICIDPFLVKADYAVKIPGKAASLLGLNEPGEAFVVTFVTVAEDPKEITTNLLAPVVLNVRTGKGRQVIQDADYPVQFRIWDEIERMEQNLKG
jgi:flagellar assembly factor FliW